VWAKPLSRCSLPCISRCLIFEYFGWFELISMLFSSSFGKTNFQAAFCAFSAWQCPITIVEKDGSFHLYFDRNKYWYKTSRMKSVLDLLTRGKRPTPVSWSHLESAVFPIVNPTEHSSIRTWNQITIDGIHKFYADFLYIGIDINRT
jgi:hypothetical protein